MQVTLITGAPCSGKSTYVRKNMAPGDLVIDHDALAQALGSPDSHDHPDSLTPFIFEARDALMRRLGRAHSVLHVWLVKCDPVQADYALRPQIVTLDTSRVDCHARAVDANRPDRWHEYIDQWFDARNIT